MSSTSKGLLVILKLQTLRLFCFQSSIHSGGNLKIASMTLATASDEKKRFLQWVVERGADFAKYGGGKTNFTLLSFSFLGWYSEETIAMCGLALTWWSMVLAAFATDVASGNVQPIYICVWISRKYSWQKNFQSHDPSDAVISDETFNFLKEARHLQIRISLQQVQKTRFKLHGCSDALFHANQ